MADTLIRGMEMPKYTTKAEFGIDADGNPLCMVYHDDGTEPDIYDVVPLPEGHGKCIDADALIRDKSGEATLWCGYEYQDHSVVFEEDIKNAPTIVPAEGGRTNPPPKSVAQRWVVTDRGWKCPSCSGEIDAEIQWLVSPEFPKYCLQCGRRLALHDA